MLTTHEQYIEQSSSEKITLAHIFGSERLFVFVNESGSIFSKNPGYFVESVKINQVVQTLRLDSSVVSGEFYYDIINNKLWIHSDDIINDEIIVTYKFFYSTAPIILSNNLDEQGEPVTYDPRIKSFPTFKTDAGVENNKISVTGSGTLVLENTDLELGELLNNVTFENKSCKIYSHNRNLPVNQAKLIFQGTIQSKGIDFTTQGNSKVSFQIKDLIFNISDILPLETYTENITNSRSLYGKYRRLIYGRVDGLRGRSLDTLGEGTPLSGSISGDVGQNLINGSGTDFLHETSINDVLVLEGGVELTISDIVDATTLEVSGELDFPISSSNVILRTSEANKDVNREWDISGHKLTQETSLVTEGKQLNRLTLDDASNLTAGDKIQIDGQPFSSIVQRVSGNKIILRTNLVSKPAVGTLVTRLPIQNVYYNQKTIVTNDYTVTNDSTGCKITFGDNVEFNSTDEQVVPGATLEFIAGSREVSRSSGTSDLTQYLKSRDFVRPLGNASNWYEVLKVEENKIHLRDPSLTTESDSVTYKSIEYINEDSTITVDALGKPDENGRLISSAPSVVRDILSLMEVPSELIEESSFTESATRTPFLVSYKIPFSIDSNSPNAKSIIDDINNTINGSLTQSLDLKLQYKVLNNTLPSDIPEINDTEIISWKLKGNTGKIYGTINSSYRFSDADKVTGEEGSEIASFQSQWVLSHIGVNSIVEKKYYLYNKEDVEIYSKRFLFENSLFSNEFELKSSINLMKFDIGDVVLLNFEDLPKTLGLKSTNRRLVMVSKIVRNGENVTLTCTDLGEIFNRVANLTEEDADIFDDSEVDQKLKHGFLTDDVGLVPTIEETYKVNKIG